jgi:hypothetical protein
MQSGVHGITSQALHAIVGALALERGSAVANKFVREKILKERLIMLPIPKYWKENVETHS